MSDPSHKTTNQHISVSLSASTGRRGADELRVTIGGMNLLMPIAQARTLRDALDQALSLIERAKGHVMTPDERRAQRLSFLRGQTGASTEEILRVLPELAEAMPMADDPRPQTTIARLRREAEMHAASEDGRGLRCTSLLTDAADEIERLRQIEDIAKDIFCEWSGGCPLDADMKRLRPLLYVDGQP